MGYTLFLLINTACDISCSYCFYTTGHESRDGKQFDVQLAPILTERLTSLEFSRVILTGGDPLNRRAKRNTMMLVRALKDAGIAVIINTSGAYLNSDDCAALIECQPDRIDFSIDSHLETVHDGLRGRYKDTVNAIRTLIEMGYTSIVTTTVVTPENAPSLRETLSFLRGLGVVDCRVQPAFLPQTTIVPRRRTDRVVLTDSMRHAFDEIAQDSGNPRTFRRYFGLWELYFGDPTLGSLALSGAQPYCQMGKESFVADSACNLTGCFHRSDVRLGNLLTDSIDELRDALTTNQLRADDLPPCAGAHCVSLFERPSNWKES